MDISAIEPFLDCGRINFRFLSFLISIRDAERGIGEKMGIGRGKTEEEVGEIPVSRAGSQKLKAAEFLCSQEFLC